MRYVRTRTAASITIPRRLDEQQKIGTDLLSTPFTMRTLLVRMLRILGFGFTSPWRRRRNVRRNTGIPAMDVSSVSMPTAVSLVATNAPKPPRANAADSSNDSANSYQPPPPPPLPPGQGVQVDQLV